MNSESPSPEIATFGGGCFWCTEAVFTRLRGIVEVVSGYSGGSLANPTYQEICDGNTGHAEVVRIRFDPKEIGYRELLDVFFATHDPTTLNRQGNDIGSQYRSVIFTHSEQQAQIARQVIAELNATAELKNSIVTEVLPAARFWAAEDYHQDYFVRNGRQPYCQIVVGPKVAKFRDKFRRSLKDGM